MRWPRRGAPAQEMVAFAYSLCFVFPCDTAGSVTIACAILSAEIALAMAESLSYLADAEGSEFRP